MLSNPKGPILRNKLLC